MQTKELTPLHKAYKGGNQPFQNVIKSTQISLNKSAQYNKELWIEIALTKDTTAFNSLFKAEFEITKELLQVELVTKRNGRPNLKSTIGENLILMVFNTSNGAEPNIDIVNKLLYIQNTLINSVTIICPTSLLQINKDALSTSIPYIDKAYINNNFEFNVQEKCTILHLLYIRCANHPSHNLASFTTLLQSHHDKLKKSPQFNADLWLDICTKRDTDAFIKLKEYSFFPPNLIYSMHSTLRDKTEKKWKECRITDKEGKQSIRSLLSEHGCTTYLAVRAPSCAITGTFNIALYCAISNYIITHNNLCAIILQSTGTGCISWGIGFIGNICYNYASVEQDWNINFVYKLCDSLAQWVYCNPTSKVEPESSINL